jgi:hypothetical protein
MTLRSQYNEAHAATEAAFLGHSETQEAYDHWWDCILKEADLWDQLIENPDG